MRRLEKIEVPSVLEANAEIWLQEYIADPNNGAKRYRYRHEEIKGAIVQETGWKCAYCESKVAHNTPGDIEHKVPTSKAQHLHFTWSNLTCACTECNRRKRDYYVEGSEFIDPYADNVEDLVLHHGPITSWRPGHERAELSIKLLQLNHPQRMQLVLRKIEKINQFEELAERYASTENAVLKEVLLKQLQEMRDRTSEYSAMLVTVGQQKGVPD